MKIYILADKNNIPYTVNAYLAYNGFEQLGYEVILIKTIDDIKDNNPENIVFAGIGNVKNYINNVLKLDIDIENFDYPSELSEYLGRNLHKDKFNKFISEFTGDKPLFIKPVNEQKLFTGVLINEYKDIPPLKKILIYGYQSLLNL